MSPTVLTPTLYDPSLAQAAGVLSASADRDERAGGRIGFAPTVVAPAFHGAALAQTAGVPVSRGYCDKRSGRRVGLAKPVTTPALDGAGVEQDAGVRFAHGDWYGQRFALGFGGSAASGGVIGLGLLLFVVNDLGLLGLRRRFSGGCLRLLLAAAARGCDDEGEGGEQEDVK